MNIFSKINLLAKSFIRIGQSLQELNNQVMLINQKLDALNCGCGNQTEILNNRLKEVREGLANLAADVNKQFGSMPKKIDNLSEINSTNLDGSGEECFIPLLIDEKTYNASHPDYDVNVVRNYPGKILNFNAPCNNAIYAQLNNMTNNSSIPYEKWKQILEQAMEELKSVPHVEQIFERRDYTEKYVADLGRKYGARYIAGWVNLEDALFLYWLVRRLNPKTIVQTGVCNGLSAAFMVLALVKNGGHGKLLAVDLPHIFDPKDSQWTKKDGSYGVLIPEGKTSGWLVPDAYRHLIEVRYGDAKILLPELLKTLDGIDMFYHDSDHTYNHMMFEFQSVKNKMSPGSIIVADDIAWNSSLWDFADEHSMPSYNFNGSVGVAFVSTG